MSTVEVRREGEAHRGIRVLAVTAAGFLDPAHIWRAPLSLDAYRARRAALAAEAAAMADRLDWRGFSPDDDDAPRERAGGGRKRAGGGSAGGGSAESGAPGSAVTTDTDTDTDTDTARAGADAARADPARADAEERAWQAELRRLVEEEVVAQVRHAMATGRRLPTAAEYRSWSDERIAALRAEGDALDDAALAADPLSADTLGTGMLGTGMLAAALATRASADRAAAEPVAAPAGLDLHPLNRVMERVEHAQALLRQAEAARVGAAATAWKAALEFVTGTPDSAVNGPFQRSILMQLAHDLQVAEQTAAALVHAALDLERCTPRGWAAFQAGDVPWRGMQMLHAALDGLDPQFWDEFDEKAVVAITTVAMPKLKARLHSIRERVQAVTASERHRRAVQRMGVTLEPVADGMAVLTAVLPAPEAIAIDLRLDKAAREAASAEGETRSIGQLRAHILMDLVDEGLFRGPRPDVQDDLAVPQRRGVQCKVGLLIPAMSAMGHCDVPAQLEGYGPIDLDTAKRLAGAATSWIKVLTDPVTGAVLDIGREKYRPTADMRALLGILDRSGRGPNSARPPSQCEADHVDPFRQGLARGRTALDNLVLLAVRDHRIKTTGLWEIELRARRDLAWTSFMGTRIITTVEPLEPTPVPPGDVECPSDGPDDRAPVTARACARRAGSRRGRPPR